MATKDNIRVREVTNEKVFIDDKILPIAKTFFVDTCQIWKTTQHDKEKRRKIVEDFFAEKWIRYLTKRKVKFYAATSENNCQGAMIVYHSKDSKTLDFEPSLKSKAKISWKIGFGVSNVNRFFWTMKKIHGTILSIVESNPFMWVMHPSPFMSLSESTKLLDQLITLAKKENTLIVHEVHSLEHANELEQYGFHRASDVSFFYEEKPDQEANLPMEEQEKDNKEHLVKIYVMTYEPPDYKTINNSPPPSRKELLVKRIFEQKHEKKFDEKKPVGERNSIMPTASQDQENYGELPLSQSTTSQATPAPPTSSEGDDKLLPPAPSDQKITKPYEGLPSET